MLFRSSGAGTRAAAAAIIQDRPAYKYLAFNPPCIKGGVHAVPLRETSKRLKEMHTLAGKAWESHPTALKGRLQHHHSTIATEIHKVLEYMPTYLTGKLARASHPGDKKPRFRKCLFQQLWAALFCRFFGATSQHYVCYGLCCAEKSKDAQQAFKNLKALGIIISHPELPQGSGYYCLSPKVAEDLKAPPHSKHTGAIAASFILWEDRSAVL